MEGGSRGFGCGYCVFGFHGCGSWACCRSRCIRTAYYQHRALDPLAARKIIPLLANRIKKFDQRIECLNYRQKVIRHTVKRIAIMIVNLADLIKPTPHFFKFLPLRQISSPVDERYKNKIFENIESVFAKTPPPPQKKNNKCRGGANEGGQKRLHC